MSTYRMTERRRHALMRDSQGRASGPLAVALDLIAESAP